MFLSKSIDRMRTKRNVASFFIRSICDTCRIEPPHHHACIIIDVNEEHFNHGIYLSICIFNIFENKNKSDRTIRAIIIELSHLTLFVCFVYVCVVLYKFVMCAQLRFASSRKRNCRRFLSIYNFSSIIIVKNAHYKFNKEKHKKRTRRQLG